MRNRKGQLLVAVGLLLMAAALFLLGYNLYDAARAADAVEQARSQLAVLIPAEDLLENVESLPAETTGAASPTISSETVLSIPDYLLNPGMEMPTRMVDGVAYIGILQIPTLELELPVISQWSYAALKQAPCRYSGSAYTGNLILAGHNYATHFGRLQSLHQEDTVIFTDMDGNRFVYKVVEVESLPDTAVEEMEMGQWELTLFTCNYSRDRRITIRCEQVDT